MLQTFLPLFIMTFGICLFIVLMQFIWRYIDDMVGKGFELTVLAEMLFYAALSLVPMALPLSILLSSLMAFGNLGERLELLAMKSAGVSLLHIMRPLTLFVAIISIGAFFFQNNVTPVAQVKLYSLLFSMRQKSPELDIPEGIFCKEISGFNVYVKEKDKTGLLKNIMIYNYSQGFEKVDVTVADSGRLKTSADKLFLVLTLFNGESFQNLSQGQGKKNEAFPYRRETFSTKELLIDFDANFVRTDESFLQNRFMGKDMKNLQFSIDSLGTRLDSIKNLNARTITENSYKKTLSRPPVNNEQEDLLAQDNPWGQISPKAPAINIDSLFQAETPSSRAAILGRVKSSIDNIKSEYYFKSFSLADEAYNLRRHITEWHSKFTVSFSCLVFFFIGAPIGAIIRKGGLGTPVVVSIFLFIFYYMVNNIGVKMARDGIWPAWEGMWLSSFVLVPMGIFLTYKAVNDSVILNADTYINAIKGLFGKKETRKVEKKEVIIFDPDYHSLPHKLADLRTSCETWINTNKKRISYFKYWALFGKDTNIPKISAKLEAIVDELSNSDQNLILNKLMDFPIITGYTLLTPNKITKARILLAILFPIGLPLYFGALYQRKLLLHDLKIATRVCVDLDEMVEKTLSTTHTPD